MINEAAIKNLVADELERATAKYGDRFHSYHEAWAVIQEEVDEAQDEINYMNMHVRFAWDSVKSNNNLEALNTIGRVKYTAIKAIAELIQVAAMCEKATRGL